MKNEKVFKTKDMEQGERGRGRFPFAGEKVPSMKRRCEWHDYTQRQMYMINVAPIIKALDFSNLK